MCFPGNGIFILRGEILTITAAINRSKWFSIASSNEEEGNILKSVQELRSNLLAIHDLQLISPKVYLSPFLSLIKSDKTSGTLTNIALTSVYKVLSYGLLNLNSPCQEYAVSELVEKIADATTHTRFIGTDQASDGIVLFKVVQVLRQLMLSQTGKYLSNESICEIMLSCFRICFESKLNELLRRTAESALKDMVLHLFSQLPNFVKDDSNDLKPFRIAGNIMEELCIRQISKNQPSTKIEAMTVNENTIQLKNTNAEIKTEKVTSLKNQIIDLHGKISPLQNETLKRIHDKNIQHECFDREVTVFEKETTQNLSETFIEPYGLPCLRELFRFLISLCDPTDKQNSDSMIHTGLCLLIVAFEIAADHMTHYPSLLILVQNELCRNLIALLDTDRLSIYAADLQVCFLIFESMRSFLKFQFEKFLIKLVNIISSEQSKIQQDAKEMALDNLLQFLRIPGLLGEIYINYDCDFYCANILKDTIQQLYKQTQSTLGPSDTIIDYQYEALLVIVDMISKFNIRSTDGISIVIDNLKGDSNSIHETASPYCPLNVFICEPKFQIGEKTILMCIKRENLLDIERKKAILAQGIELFNKHPDRGIQFLQEHSILQSPINPNEIVLFLREHPQLDKKVVGEFISKKKNVELKILKAYVESFNFTDMPIETSLRSYLAAFRLPGEAPLIFLVLEEFAEYWHKSNGEPFSNADAAFRLAYAIIMLNMDQHNQNAKRLNIPMTEEDFIKNLRGLNGNGDFDEEMLRRVFNSIKSDEMVVPTEQSGPVRDNYLWQMLLIRGSGAEGIYYHSCDPVYMELIFKFSCKSIINILSVMLEKSYDINRNEKTRNGFVQIAFLCSLYQMNEELDLVVLTLCKLTMLLLNGPDGSKISNYIQFAQNQRSQFATQTLFEIINLYGYGIREGWKYIIDILVRLFKLKLLPDSFVVIDDFCEPNSKFSLLKDNSSMIKTESGLFSSLVTYLSADTQRQSPTEEDVLLNSAKLCIEKCHLDIIFSQSKLLSYTALGDVIDYLMSVIKCPKKQLNEIGQAIPDDILIFSLELMVKILAKSGEQMNGIWDKITDLFNTLNCTALCKADFILHRINSAILRISITAMQHEEMCPNVLTTLNLYLSLEPLTAYKISDHVTAGINEMLKKSAQNIHTEKEWETIFSILEYFGAGVVYEPDSLNNHNNCSIIYPCKFINHSTVAFKKSIDSLGFVIRNVAHVTPYNFERCVATIRKFLEASLRNPEFLKSLPEKNRKKLSGSNEDDKYDDNERTNAIILQLLDLMHTLHSRTAVIYRWWAEEGGSTPHCSALWRHGWCPLLQGMTRAGFDHRKDIRASAITYLQRALLLHDLETLTGVEWASCLQDVLFPLLKHLIGQDVSQSDLNAFEEARSRTVTMICKLFLHHLQPLLLLPNINELWMDILSFIECLTRIGSDELVEAVKESLKNMLLVMRSVKIFAYDSEKNQEFWELTWNRLDTFLPNLKGELHEQDLFMDQSRRQVHISNFEIDRKTPPISSPRRIPSSSSGTQSPPVIVSPTQSPQHLTPLSFSPTQRKMALLESSISFFPTPNEFLSDSEMCNLHEQVASSMPLPYDAKDAFVSIEKVTLSENKVDKNLPFYETRETIVCLDDTVDDLSSFKPTKTFCNNIHLIHESTENAPKDLLTEKGPFNI